MENFDQRIKDAAACFLERRGFEIIERDWEAPEGDGGFDIIAMEGDTLVFAKANGRDAKSTGFGFTDASFERETDEAHALQYMSLHADDFPECPIRFDSIAITIISEDRAVIRHYVNCMSTYNLKEE